MYKPGDVRLVDPPCEDGYEEWEEEGHRYTDCDGKGEGHVHSLYDFSYLTGKADRWFPPCAYLLQSDHTGRLLPWPSSQPHHSDL